MAVTVGAFCLCGPVAAYHPRGKPPFPGLLLLKKQQADMHKHQENNNHFKRTHFSPHFQCDVRGLDFPSKRCNPPKEAHHVFPKRTPSRDGVCSREKDG